MNKFVTESDKGEKALVLVLEPGNLEKLKKYDPVVINVEDMFPTSVFPDGVPKKLALIIAFSPTPVSDSRALRDIMEQQGNGAQFRDEASTIAKAKRPHCPECKSTVEQLGVLDSNPVIIFCTGCGAVLGIVNALARPQAAGRAFKRGDVTLLGIPVEVDTELPDNVIRVSLATMQAIEQQGKWTPVTPEKK